MRRSYLEQVPYLDPDLYIPRGTTVENLLAKKQTGLPVQDPAHGDLPTYLSFSETGVTAAINDLYGKSLININSDARNT